MWEYEHSVTAEVTPAAVWKLWSDAENWAAWNDGVGVVDLKGPFAAGTQFTMNPPGQDTITMTLTEVVENELFTDVAEFGGLVITTYHRIEALDGGRTKVTYRTEITGEGADEAGPQVGPEICADFPEVVAKLVELAGA
jgi:uncharacterized protein YndB with AHSA1/START domain